MTNESSRSESSELADGEEFNDIPGLTKQLKAVNHVNLIHPKRTQRDHQEYGLWRSRNSSSEEEGGLTGRIRLSHPEMPRPTRKIVSTKLPSFLQKPTHGPTVPPVEVEFCRLAHHVETDKLGRIIDCLVTLADKGSGTTDES